MSHAGSNRAKTWAKIAAPVLVAGLAFAGWDLSKSAPSSDSDSCAVKTLPKEASDQIRDILTDAPPDDGEFDGKHFGNFEGILPKKDSNYYREYTVKTPNLNHRGERRIVVGGGTKTRPEVWYYSSDHYQHFCRISDATSVSSGKNNR